MSSQTAKARILVVDDDPVLRILEQRGLAAAGYDAHIAVDGSQAIETIKQQDFDLVIVDLMMPVMGGLKFLRWLRQEHQSEIPAIVFTSHDRAEVEEEAKQAGGSCVLHKPINLAEFVQTVSDLLR